MRVPLTKLLFTTDLSHRFIAMKKTNVSSTTTSSVPPLVTLSLLVGSIASLLIIAFIVGLTFGWISIPVKTPFPPERQLATITTTAEMAQSYETISETLNSLAARGEILVGVGKESGPYSWESPLGSANFDGFEVKLVQEFARRWESATGKKIKVKFVGLDIKDRFTAIENGQVDFTIAGILSSNPNCGAPKLICTTRPYISDQQKALVRTLSITDTLDICTYFDKDKTVAIIRNTSFENQKKTFFSQCQDRIPSETIFNTRNEAVDAIISEKTDAYITNGRMLDFYRLKSSQPESIKVVELRDSKSPGKKLPLLSELFVVALKKDREGLRQLIDFTLLALADDGTHQMLSRDSKLSAPTFEVMINKRDCESVAYYWKIVQNPDSKNSSPKCLQNP